MQSLTTLSIRAVFDRHASPLEEPASHRREGARRKAFEDLERQDARLGRVAAADGEGLAVEVGERADARVAAHDELAVEVAVAEIGRAHV